jgi:SPX domain
MKFAKKLETDTENLPDELRQHLIRYKYLKKAISKIVDEMEQRGLSATLLSEWLRKSSDETEGEEDDSLKIEYFFVGKYIPTETMKRGKHIADNIWLKGQPPDIRTCIRITYLENDPRVQQLLKPTELVGNDQEVLSTPLEFRYSKDDTDYFSLSPPPSGFLSDQLVKENGSPRRGSSSSAKLAKTLLDLSLNEPKEHSHQPRASGKLNATLE